MTQREFGTACGSSHRTAVRWDAGQSSPGYHDLVRMAELILPHDRDLAIEVASHANQTLVGLGLEPPPHPPAPPPARPAEPAPPHAVRPAPEHLVDILVCAAVEATGQQPAAMRPLVYRLFKRAREIGMTPAEVEKALEPPAVDAASAAR
jgi:hypothetical protein